MAGQPPISRELRLLLAHRKRIGPDLRHLAAKIYHENDLQQRSHPLH